MSDDRTAPFFLYAIDPKTHHFKNPTTGQWVTDENFLERYAQDIRVDPLKDPNVSHSVPSVFARAIQFFNALKNENNPLHDALVAEWRGLLAVIGLRKRFGFILDFDLVSVVPTSSGTEADERFKRMLRSQLPYPEKDWEQWWMVSCNGQLLGATSPWSIVYTPAGYQCSNIIPWLRDGILIDPIEYYRKLGISVELTLLQRWVKKLIDDYNDKQYHWGMPDAFNATIRSELEKWEKELRDYSDVNQNIKMEVEDRTNASQQDPYWFFLREVTYSGIEEKSDLLLRAKRFEAPKTLVLPRKGIPNKSRICGSILWDQVKDSDLTRPEGKANWKTHTGVSIPYAYVIPEEVFLPSKLLAIGQSDEALVIGEGAAAKKYATPLTRRFFDFFSLADLIANKNMLTVQEEKNRVRVKLRLPLSGGVPLDVERVYEGDNIISSEAVGGTPVLACWPDFYSEEWRENVAVFYAPRTQERLMVAPLLSTSESVSPNSKADGIELETRLWYRDKPVMGFELYYREPGQESTTAGVVLRKELKPPLDISENKKWVVAVDFGTSNTNVWVKDEQGNRNPLNIQPRTKVLTQAVEERVDDAISNLYSTDVIEPHFPSLAAEQRAEILTGGSHDIVASFESNFFRMLTDTSRFVVDLKWGAGGATAGDRPLKGYLKDVLRFIICEARAQGVSMITLRWSYPLALPKKPRTAIKNFWSAAESEIQVPEGMKLQVETVGISESEAIAKCMQTFGQLVPEANALSIGVDIGGGSTDVAFWIEGRNVENLSLKLAGGDLTRPMCRLPNWPEQMLKALSPGLSKELIADSTSRFADESGSMLVNYLLTKVRKTDHTRPTKPLEHPLATALYTSLNKGDAPWKYACSASYLFFSGMAFYLGLHTRNLIADPKLTANMTQRAIVIFFGGLGTSLLTWVSRDWNDLNAILRDAFRDGLLRNAKENEDLKISISSHINANIAKLRPKDEVAKGLLDDYYDNPLRQKPDTEIIQKETIIGELGWKRKSDDSELKWNDKLTPEIVDQISPPANFDSCYLATFLRTVLPRHMDKHSLDTENLSKLELGQPYLVQNRIITAVSGGQTIIQPIFINELKLLIEEYFKMSGVAIG